MIFSCLSIRQLYLHVKKNLAIIALYYARIMLSDISDHGYEPQSKLPDIMPSASAMRDCYFVPLSFARGIIRSISFSTLCFWNLGLIIN